MPELDLATLLMDAMLSVGGQARCCYVAGALTSGRHLYEAATRAAVVNAGGAEAENRAHMAAVVEDLRARRSYPVIDASILKVQGWSGPDYGRFFLRVLECLCKEVVLLDGWEFSAGATNEFVRAHELGLPTFDERGAVLGRIEGAALLTNAIRVVKSSGSNPQRFERRLSRLQELK